MMGRRLPALALALLVAALLSACGGGSGGDSSTGDGSRGDPAPKQFVTRGGDNSIQEFGSEASGPELRAAAAGLHGYLDARAAGAWGRACSYLAPGVAASLRQLTGGSRKAACPQILAALSAEIPPASLRAAAVADAGALRVEGRRAFLLFHGARGEDFFMPMVSTGGGWKVAAIAASAIP